MCEISWNTISTNQQPTCEILSKLPNHCLISVFCICFCSYCSRSRTAKRQGTASLSSEAGTEDRNHKHLTLTAAFSFDNNKSPVASSRKLEERLKQGSSLGSFRVEEPPLNGPIRDTHELVLSYIRQENPAYYDKSKKLQEYAVSEKRGENRQTDNLLKSTSTASKYYLDDLDTSQISSTFPPERDTKRILAEESISNTNQFRIVVPSTTPDYSLTEEVTIRPKLSHRRGNIGHLNPTGSTTISYETVKPYKLPLLTRESVESLSVKQIRPQGQQQTTEQISRSRSADHMDSSNLPYRKRNMNESQSHESIGLSKVSSEVTKEETLKFVPFRGTDKTLLQGASRSQHITRNGTGAVLHNIPNVNPLNKKTNEEVNVSNEQSNTSPFQDNRQYLKGISTTEESILKLIPIKTVRSRLQSQAGNEDILFDGKYDTVTATDSMPKKEYNNYQANEDTEDIENTRPISVVGRSRYQPQITQDNLLKSKGNSPDYQKNLYEEPIYTTTSNYDRIQSRLSQTTRTPYSQKQIYSLTINDEQVKQSNNGGGILLATLETITNIPINRENNPKQHNMASSTKEVPNLQTTHIDQNTSLRIDSHSLGQHQSSNHIERPSYTNQIRMRNRTRPSILSNVYSDRKVPIPLDSTTERNENEEVTSVQMKYHSKIRQREEQPITEKTLVENHQKLKTTQETEKESLLTPNTESDIRNKWPADSSLNINSKYNTQPLTHHNVDQRKRQFKQKNRLITFPDNEDEISHPSKDTADFDSQEEIDVYTKEENANKKDSQTVDKKKSRNGSDSVLKTEVHFENTRSETRPTTTANTVESATFENDSDLSGEIIQERQQNVRKMHIRKKIRVTPVKSQSTTQSYDDTYNTYYSKSRKTTLNVEEQPSLTQFTENESINYDDNSKSNLVAVTPGFTIPKTRGPLGYRSNHKENEHRSLESSYNQVEEKRAQHFELNSQTPAIDPYALLRSSWPKTSELNGKNSYDEQVTLQTEKPVKTRNKNVETKPMSPIAIEINSYFKEGPQNSTVSPTTVIYTKASTTPFPLTTAERIKDKFRLGSFPKPAPPSNSYVRKPSVEDNTPPPLPSDRCSQELDNESECNEKPLLR